MRIKCAENSIDKRGPNAVTLQTETEFIDMMARKTWRLCGIESFKMPFKKTVLKTRSFLC